jgi:hypothetical protein
MTKSCISGVIVEDEPLDILRLEYAKAWREAEKEIFRIQLLTEYPDSEKAAYDEYKKGNVIKSANVDSNIEFISRKVKNGVKMVNLLVVDIPLSTYTKFSIETTYIYLANAGYETFLVERSKVADIVKNTKDFWLFDNKKVLPMLYDIDGHVIGALKPITDEKVGGYVKIKEKVLPMALPLTEFLKVNKINLSACKNKSTS